MKYWWDDTRQLWDFKPDQLRTYMRPFNTFIMLRFFKHWTNAELKPFWNNLITMLLILTIERILFDWDHHQYQCVKSITCYHDFIMVHDFDLGSTYANPSGSIFISRVHLKAYFQLKYAHIAKWSRNAIKTARAAFLYFRLFYCWKFTRSYSLAHSFYYSLFRSLAFSLAY